MAKISSVAVRRARALLGTLLGLNLVAAGLVLYPPGGSVESLEQQLITLRTQLQTKKTQIVGVREHASSVEKGRADGDKFLDRYFLARRSAYISVLAELGETARTSKLKERENAFAIEDVEGSDQLKMMTVTANYEGTYRDLLAFVREIDRSKLLLVIESLNAVPQAGTNTLLVSMKIEAFVREDGSAVETEADPKAVAMLGGAR